MKEADGPSRKTIKGVGLVKGIYAQILKYACNYSGNMASCL